MIYFGSPYLQGNIGGAWNRFCCLVPDGDWICLVDADAMFLQPDYGSFVEDIAENSDYDLIGCVTNRVRNLRQCHDNDFSDNMDVRIHYDIAKERRVLYGTTVEPFHCIAGLFMLFRKSLWDKVGGFREHTMNPDVTFSAEAKTAGAKVGIAKGLYLFHGYRIWQQGREASINDIAHLEPSK